MISSKVISACLVNDRKAHKDLYELCAPYVYSVVKNYVFEHNLRKDAMQETFVQIFLSLKNYDENKGNFKSWIAKIAVYKSIDVLKKHTKGNQFYTLEIVKETPEYSFAYLDELSQNEIEVLLDKMPLGFRIVFLLSVMDGFSHKEIAELLDIKPETSRSQLMRGIKWIKKNINVESKLLKYEAL